MFFYTVMNIFITLLENVNNSHTSAGKLSLNKTMQLDSQRQLTMDHVTKYAVE
jgi:hypothetical protein